MATPKEIFKDSGPKHLTLTQINWNCPHYPRSVVASLIQGVSVSEKDRLNNRRGREACAPPWWQSFHFYLSEYIIDDKGSIFGAIYEYKHHSLANAPKYVIAFRGTILQKQLLIEDLKMDWKVVINRLNGSVPRIDRAMQAVQKIVKEFGPGHLWLAGYSLGAAIAMLVGKCMAKLSINLKTFLFNPPYFAVPTELIRDEKIKQGLRIAGDVVTAGLTIAVKGRDHSSESFALLASWVPNLFVNAHDVICSNYIGYFERRQVMEGKGLGGIGKIATQNSVRSLAANAWGKDSEPLHLIPSAILTVNRIPFTDFRTSHCIHQWFISNPNFEVKKYPW